MKGQFPREQALAAAGKLMSLSPCCELFTICGSLRRGKQIVGDVDIIVANPTPAFIRLFTEMGGVWKNKGGQIVVDGITIDVEAMPVETWGAALQYRTGSKAENLRLRGIAKAKGLKLSQYGVIRRDTGELIGGKTEESVYWLLGEPFVPPEGR